MSVTEVVINFIFDKIRAILIQIKQSLLSSVQFSLEWMFNWIKEQKVPKNLFKNWQTRRTFQQCSDNRYFLYFLYWSLNIAEYWYNKNYLYKCCLNFNHIRSLKSDARLNQELRSDASLSKCPHMSSSWHDIPWHSNITEMNQLDYVVSRDWQVRNFTLHLQFRGLYQWSPALLFFENQYIVLFWLLLE